ncbi:MAG: DUF805 domain-containing protein [Pseudomonadota bacterium]
MQRLIKIFLAFDGRIGRATFWLAAIAYFAVLIGGAYLIQPDYFTSTEIVAPSLAQSLWVLALAWPSYAITKKRLNDRDWPAWVFLIVVAVTVPFFIGPFFGVLVSPETGASWETALWIAMTVVAVPLLIDNGFMSGTDGPNRYGPDPSDGAASAST